MNNSNKGRFNWAKKQAHKGNKQTKIGNKTWCFEIQPRLSKRPKVGRGRRNDEGKE